MMICFVLQNVTQTRQVWVESLDESDSGLSKDLIPLHPDVWSVKPRLDILWQNIDWQLRYKRVDYDVQKDSKEMHYGGRPWPQVCTILTFNLGRLFNKMDCVMSQS